MFEQPKSEERLFFYCFVYVKAWGWTPTIVWQRVLMKHLHWAGVLWKLANSECFAAGLLCAIDIFGSGHNDEIVHVQLIPQITWHGTEFACSMCCLFYCGGDGLWKVHILWGFFDDRLRAIRNRTIYGLDHWPSSGDRLWPASAVEVAAEVWKLALRVGFKQLGLSPCQE